MSQYNTNYKKPYYDKWRLKKLIFPPQDGVNVFGLKIDPESYVYITFYETAEKITDFIRSVTDEPLENQVITDMTAGVGGNVINFAKYFRYVNAIELDKIRYGYLSDNINMYNITNVNCYHNDSYRMMIEEDNLVQDIVFFDPPWGGKDYKKYDTLRLTFNNKAIEEVVLSLLNYIYTRMVVLKLPKNYDMDYLHEQLHEYKIMAEIIDRVLIVIVLRK